MRRRRRGTARAAGRVLSWCLRGMAGRGPPSIEGTDLTAIYPIFLSNPRDMFWLSRLLPQLDDPQLAFHQVGDVDGPSHHAEIGRALEVLGEGFQPSGGAPLG